MEEYMIVFENDITQGEHRNAKRARNAADDKDKPKARRKKRELTEEQKERNRIRERERWHKLTPEQKRERYERYRKNSGGLTPEQRAARNRQSRERRKKLTPQQLEEVRRKERERHHQMSIEQRDRRRQCARARWRKLPLEERKRRTRERWLKLTPEQRTERHRRQISRMTAEQIERHRKLTREWWRKQPLEMRKQRSQKRWENFTIEQRREYCRRYYATLTLQQREMRKRIARERYRKMTVEEREKYRQMRQKHVCLELCKNGCIYRFIYIKGELRVLERFKNCVRCNRKCVPRLNSQNPQVDNNEKKIGNKFLCSLCKNRHNKKMNEGRRLRLSERYSEELWLRRQAKPWTRRLATLNGKVFKKNLRPYCYTCETQFADENSLYEHVLRHVSMPHVILVKFEKSEKFLPYLCNKNLTSGEFWTIKKDYVTINEYFNNSYNKSKAPHPDDKLSTEYVEIEIPIEFEKQVNINNVIKTEPIWMNNEFNTSTRTGEDMPTRGSPVSIGIKTEAIESEACMYIKTEIEDNTCWRNDTDTS